MAQGPPGPPAGQSTQTASAHYRMAVLRCHAGPPVEVSPLRAPRFASVRKGQHCGPDAATCRMLVAGGAFVASCVQLQSLRRSARSRYCGPTRLHCFDESGVPCFEESQQTETAAVQVPLLLVEDVYLPGAPVTLPVADKSTSKLYDSMLAPKPQHSPRFSAFDSWLHLPQLWFIQPGLKLTLIQGHWPSAGCRGSV